MSSTPRVRVRARRIAVLCGAGVLAIGVIAVPPVIRLAQESRAIAALRSGDDGERSSAIQALARLGSRRAVLALLASRELPRVEGAGTPFHESCGEVCDAMASIGSCAVPALRLGLGSEDPAERYWALHYLRQLPELSPDGPGPELQPLLDDPHPLVREAASVATGAMAERSPAVFERLLIDLGTPGLGERRRAAVGKAIEVAALLALDGASDRGLPDRQAMAEAAFLALVEATVAASPAVQEACIRGLHAIEYGWSAADPAVPMPDGLDLLGSIRETLRRWLGAEDAAARRLGLQFLEYWNAGERDESLPGEILEVLARCLSDPDPWIKDLAEERLVREEAIPVLVGVLERGEPESRLRARRALEKTGESVGAGKVWHRIFRLLRPSDDSIAMREMEVLLSVLGEKDGIGIDELVTALGSTEPAVRRLAIGVLVRYRAAESFDDDGLIDLLDHEDEEVRSHAALAFSWSRRLRVPASEEVARALMVGGPAALRRASCRGAKDLGPAARDAVPMLVSLLEARPWAGQAMAAEALGAMGPAAAAAVPALLGATQAADPELVAAALDALCRISPGKGIPAASRALEHENGGVRDAALTALWGLGSDAVPALPALRKTASGDGDPAIAARAGRLVQLIDARSGRSTPEAR